MVQLFRKFRKMEEQLIGINERNQELIYRYNKRKDYILADDKYLAKEILESAQIACPKTYGVINHLTEIEAGWQNVSQYERLVIKPAKGSGGKGIMILKNHDGQWYSGNKKIQLRQIFDHLANIIFGLYSFGDSDKALIEEFVVPHDFFAEIYPSGVPDFRVILLKGQPLMAMLRMPTKRSRGKANLHQGGLGIGIDIERGVLKQAFDGKKYIDHHPDGGVILNKTVPNWKTLLSISIEVSEQFPLEYLGVDMVIDKEKGPMVMEVNVRPGLGIQLANRQGLKEVLNQNQCI